MNDAQPVLSMGNRTPLCLKRRLAMPRHHCLGPILSMLVVVAIFMASPHVAHATSAPSVDAGDFSPAVIEWFENLHPKPGRHEIVYVKLLKARSPVRGARLAGGVVLGKRTLLSFSGGVTGASGKAQAGFRVPNAARGHTVRVDVRLIYKSHAAVGYDDLHIDR